MTTPWKLKPIHPKNGVATDGIKKKTFPFSTLAFFLLEFEKYFFAFSWSSTGENLFRKVFHFYSNKRLGLSFTQLERKRVVKRVIAWYLKNICRWRWRLNQFPTKLLRKRKRKEIIRLIICSLFKLREMSEKFSKWNN